MTKINSLKNAHVYPRCCKILPNIIKKCGDCSKAITKQQWDEFLKHIQNLQWADNVFK